MAERRIAVITGTRAEYGLLSGLLHEVAGDPELDLCLIVTGMHLDPRFGLTRRAIEDDGFPIAATVDMALANDSAPAVAAAMGRITTGMADAFDRLRPDIAVVLGDRFEALAAAQAAVVCRVPLAHVHGGELTEGVMDDAFRHAITKMAQWHFVAAEPYRRRVVQLGEHPDRVFTVGAPGLDVIAGLDFMDRSELASSVGLDLDRDYFVVTYHPLTLDAGDPGRPAAELVAALDRYPQHPVVVTGVNADPGHDRVAAVLSDFAAAQPERVVLAQSLGQRRYLSAVRHCAAVVGNSSSGLIEAPALGVPTVNIGDRQKGRLRAGSVIDCGEDKDAIAAAIARALDPAFRDGLAGMETPYGTPGASARIKEHLKTVTVGTDLAKPFYDLPVAGIA